MRKSRRLIAVLATLALLATLLVPMVGPAGAATSVSVLQVPNVDDNAWQQLGTVKVEVDAGAIADRHSFTGSLPDDFLFISSLENAWAIRTVTGTTPNRVITYTLFEDNNRDRARQLGEDTNDNGVLDPGEDTDGNGVLDTELKRVRIVIPETYSGEANDLFNATGNDPFALALLDTNELQATLQNYTPAGNPNVFYVYLDSVFVKSGFSGDIPLTVEKPSTSGFPAGTATVARVPGGLVKLAVPTVNTMSSGAGIQVRIRAEELTSGSFEESNESMKIKLPNGFAFESFACPAGYLDLATGAPPAAGATDVIWYREIWGNNSINFGAPVINASRDELTIPVPAGGRTTQASYFEFIVQIAVDDETQAKTGDVVARIRGKSTFNTSELKLAEYGELGAKIEVKGSPPEVIAGQYDQEVADIVVKENVAGSLVNLRTITLELPACAKWTDVDTTDTDSGVTLNLVGFVGNDGRTIKYQVAGTSTDAAELTLEDFEIAVEPGYTGDITVKVSGTAGLSGELVIAKAKTAVAMSAAAKPNVRIGMQDQAAGDIVITEAMAGAIKGDRDLIVDLPDGVKFARVPKVVVESGDLDIDTSNVKRQNEDNQLLIPIDGESATASTIKITDIYYTIDRTVAEGDVTVKLQGPAVCEVNDDRSLRADFTDSDGTTTDLELDIDGDGRTDYTIAAVRGTLEGFFPAVTTAAKVANATCITPAPPEQKPAGKVVFTINDTKFKVGDTEQEMDVAPYIKDGRTFIPVRYAAQACGVTPENILYSDGKVTLIKGDKVIQLTIGSNVMVINGVAVNMDVAAEITNGRTMLPFRWVAQALGAKVSWDEATQTVTMEL